MSQRYTKFFAIFSIALFGCVQEPNQSDDLFEGALAQVDAGTNKQKVLLGKNIFEKVDQHQAYFGSLDLFDPNCQDRDAFFYDLLINSRQVRLISKNSITALGKTQGFSEWHDLIALKVSKRPEIKVTNVCVPTFRRHYACSQDYCCEVKIHYDRDFARSLPVSLDNKLACTVIKGTTCVSYEALGLSVSASKIEDC